MLTDKRVAKAILQRSINSLLQFLPDRVFRKHWISYS